MSDIHRNNQVNASKLGPGNIYMPVYYRTGAISLKKLKCKTHQHSNPKDRASHKVKYKYYIGIGTIYLVHPADRCQLLNAGQFQVA